MIAVLRKLGPNTEVTTVCFSCGKQQTITVKTDAFVKWQHGALIQEVMADLTPDQREMLISGTCPTCWAKLFSDNDMAIR